MTKLSCLAAVLFLVSGGCAATKIVAPPPSADATTNKEPEKAEKEEFAPWNGLLLVEQAEGTNPPKVMIVFSRKGNPDAYRVDPLKASKESSTESITSFFAPPQLPMTRYPMWIGVHKIKEVRILVDINDCLTLYTAKKEESFRLHDANGKTYGEVYRMQLDVLEEHGKCSEDEAPLPTKPE